MMGSSPSLQARLEAKRVQIIMFLAKQGGKAIWDLTPADYQNLQTIADDQLANWKKLDDEGAADTKTDGPFNRMAHDFYELQKKIAANGSS